MLFGLGAYFKDVVVDLFGYNRKNYQYDRKQRLLMELKLSGMKIEQASLWRDDVRAIMAFTPRKMEIYLTIIALELEACACALCKARVPPGSPQWLAACHTMAICTSIMYLFMALWFGLHAFVAAQAYKVRILTQSVRLPIPSWQSMEAARTYSSSYEKMKVSEMLRVPVVRNQSGECRKRAGAPTVSTVASPIPSADWEDDPALANRVGNTAAEAVSSDPWGLERPGNDVEELQPDVNSVKIEQQRHIWHVREAGRYYQTYDAFCRVCMSAGTSSLSSFFSFFCLSYVLTENAAPIAAWAGTIAFAAINIIIMGIDLKTSRFHFVLANILLFSSPILCSIVTFVSSKNSGNPGRWEWVMPVALFNRGLWFIYNLYLFRVREMKSGAMLPMAFRGVLYLDPFGWANHPAKFWRRVSSRVRAYSASSDTGRLQGVNSDDGIRVNVTGRQTESKDMLPSMACLNSGQPSRPEDIDALDSEGNVLPPRVERSTSMLPGAFRPNTFFSSQLTETEPRDPEETLQSGHDIHGEVPGIIPWRYFFINTIVVAVLWWVAAAIAVHNAYKGTAVFVQPTYGLEPGKVASLPVLLGVAVETGWRNKSLGRPRGLACDASGTIFITMSTDADGNEALFRGKLAQKVHADSSSTSTQYFLAPLPSEQIHFEPSDACQYSASNTTEFLDRPHDLTLKGDCTRKGNTCSAVLLTSTRENLLHCELGGSVSGGYDRQSLGRAWLEDRGGEKLNQNFERVDAGILEPEELSAVVSAPCAGNAHANGANTGCVVVMTTARRLVLMGGTPRNDHLRPALVPRRLLRQQSHDTTPDVGSLAMLDNRYLGILDQKFSTVQFIDVGNGGHISGTWKLPELSPKVSRSKWSSICAGGGAFFALSENADEFNLWRLQVPLQMHGATH